MSLITMVAIRLLYYLFTFTLKVDAQSTNIGLFWSKGQEVHGGKIETGVTIAIEKVNKNNNILRNSTLRFFHYRSNCDKQKILAGIIQFVAPELMDLIIGNTCQTTTELAGLVASEYNIPFFDFALRPLFLTDESYGTLMRTRDSATDSHLTLGKVCDSQRFKWTCLLVPLQIRANILRAQESFDALEVKVNFTIRENFYFDMTKPGYPALKQLTVSCRGMSILRVHLLV